MTTAARAQRALGDRDGIPLCSSEGSAVGLDRDEGHRRVLSRAYGHEVKATWHGCDYVEVCHQRRSVAIAVVLRLSEGAGPFVVCHEEPPLRPPQVPVPRPPRCGPAGEGIARAGSP